VISKFRCWNPGWVIGVKAKPIDSFTPQGIRMLISALVTFLVVILILYLINLLPLDGRAKQICRVIVIVIGVISLLKLLAVF
jgi:Na+/melibiose symporter-like transporter